ncbi:MULTISPECIES: HSP90 family protein [unclassified Isoptericola]|uniref:HSP90 family protein n=1 Tax=unclassified Isoptericola TaxID=2623355 RepID=UPI003652C3BC
MSSGTDAFQVDLRGLVELLSRHLYSSPRVYLRELLQNGVDAITARRALDPDAPARVLLRPLDDGGLEVHDTGVGLTADEARDLLATIGRSSKRDDPLDPATDPLEGALGGGFGGGREEFLGQFGIGLLSAFMVADEIDLVSRSARSPGAPPVRWRGYADGRYELTELDPADPEAPAEPGSVVRLRPLRDAEHWLEPGTVAALAADFGGLLPVDVSIETRLDDGGTARRRLSGDELPWRRAYADDAERRRALAAYCERTLGFTPLAHVDLDLPVAGLTGVAFVLPAAVAPSTSAHHRVSLKRMLLGTGVEGLLPDWAFFVRCVVDASALRPTASREGLFEDEILLAAREALGERVRAWTIETLAEPSPLGRAFLSTHHLAVRALAVQDDAMLDLAARVLPFETTVGTRTLADLAQPADGDAPARVLWTTSVEEYRRVAAVAAAQGLPVLNAGYVYDADLLARVARRHPAWRLAPVAPGDLEAVLAAVAPVRELEVTDALSALRDDLADQDCDVELRVFEPAEVPALLLSDRDGEHTRQAREAATPVDGTTDVWGAVLAGLTGPARARRLVLNDANPTVRALLAAGDAPVRAAGARSLYVTALLASGRPLAGPEAGLLDDALRTLLERALPAPPHHPGTQSSHETEDDAR